MKFDARQFVKQAEPAFAVAKESPLIPIFEYVLIAPLGEGQVAITATNYGHSIRVVADCIIQPLKAFCVFAPTLWSVLKTLDGEVEFSHDEKTTNMTCGGTSLDIPCLPAKEFPTQDMKGGTLAMSVDIKPFLEMVSDMAFFLAPDDGISIGRQNILAVEKGCYASDFVVAAGVSGKYTSKVPCLIPPSIKNRMSSFSGMWDIHAGSGWVKFSQGESFYRKNVNDFDVTAAADKAHSVIATAANTPSLASFEVARIAPAIARAVLIGAFSVTIEGSGDKITVMGQNVQAGSVLEEAIPADGAVFKTTMRTKILHGLLDVAGYVGIIGVSPQAQPDRPPSLLVKNKEKKFVSILGPVTINA